MKKFLILNSLLLILSSCKKEEIIQEASQNSNLNYFPMEFNKKKTYSHGYGLHENKSHIFTETHDIYGENWFYNNISYQGGCGSFGYYIRKGNSIFYKQNFSAYPQEIIKMDGEIGDTWQYSTDFFEHEGNDLNWHYKLQNKLDTFRVGNFLFKDVLKIQVSWLDPATGDTSYRYTEYYANNVGWIKREAESRFRHYEIIEFPAN